MTRDQNPDRLDDGARAEAEMKERGASASAEYLIDKYAVPMYGKIVGTPDYVIRQQFLEFASELRSAALPTPQGDDGLVGRLIHEYRPTMDKDVLHSWASDVVTALRARAAEIAGLKAERDDYKSDYLRRHKDVGDMLERAIAAETQLASAMEALTEMVERERRRYDNTPEAQAHFERNNAAALTALSSIKGAAE